MKNCKGGKKLLFNNAKKGITPIVSVVLLLLLTIALAGGVMVWLTGYTEAFQDDIVLRADTATCTLSSDTATVRITAENIASSAVTVENDGLIQLDGETNLNESSSVSPTSIPSGDSERLTYTVTSEDGSNIESGLYRWEVTVGDTTTQFGASC